MSPQRHRNHTSSRKALECDVCCETSCWMTLPRCWLALPRCWLALPRCWLALPRCWLALPRHLDSALQVPTIQQRAPPSMAMGKLVISSRNHNFITQSYSARAAVVIAAVVGFGAAVVEFRAAVVALLLLHGARYTQCRLLYGDLAGHALSWPCIQCRRTRPQRVPPFGCSHSPP
jgi:hypothetical protein